MYDQLKTFFLLLASTAVCYVVCETFTIVPTESSTLCPDSQICYTLNEYASNSYLSSDLDTITLELQPGTHTLDIPFAVSDISSFTMRGMDATLECKERFNVTSTVNVILRGISFINCGGRGSIFENNVRDVTNLVFEDSLFQSNEPYYVQSTNNIQLINSTFARSPRGVLSIFRNIALLIRNCTFSDNIQANRLSIGVVSVDGGSVTIEATVFRNNHMTGGQTTGAFRGRGDRLTVVNSTFFENSGGPIGAGAIRSHYRSVTISGCGFSGNYAQMGTGAVDISGTNTVLVITNRTVFFNNTGIGGITSGGAVEVHSAERSVITIEDSIFHFNNGTLGGAFGFISSDDSSILLSGCSFTQNTGRNVGYGGAIDILADNVSLTVQRSRFRGNRIVGSGGAMILSGGLRMVLINESTFESNSANSGGAISVFYSEQSDDSKFVIANSVFASNTANTRCGVLTVSASLLSQQHLLHSRTIQIDSSTFTSNKQSLNVLSGSGAICLSHTNASITNSNFSENSQRALTVRENRITVDGCNFNDNYAERDGGAVYGVNVNGTINETVFTNNRAGDSGGAVYLSNSQIAFYDSTFGSNVANRGGAIAVDNGGTLTIDDSNVFYNSFGSVISACDGTKTNVNVSDQLFATIDETTWSSKKCVVYSNSSAVSSVKVSLTSFTFFLTSMIIVVLF